MLAAPLPRRMLCGRYMLERRIGAGGMAEVFLGRLFGAEGFSRRVAIKRIRPRPDDIPIAHMFVAEARLTSRLQHINIVSVLDFLRDDDGQLFLVMELVEGVDLARLLASGPVPPPVIAFVTGEVLAGLGHAHDLPIVDDDGVRGLIHRDVSPHNVLLSWDGAVKVSDFGVAKARQASAATGSVLIKGKPAYMSPEQARGERIDGRSDLFAVGAMLWEMIAGKPLFAGSTTQETLARLMFGPIRSPRRLHPALGRDLERVTMRLLARDPERRFGHAAGAIAGLSACRAYPTSGRALLAALLAARFKAERAAELAAAAEEARAETSTPPRLGARSLVEPGRAFELPRLALPGPRLEALRAAI